MNSLIGAFYDCWLMTKRSIMHIYKNVDQAMSIVVMPIMFLLLYTYVFGGAINTGGPSYINFIVSGILAQTLAFGATVTSFNVRNDLNKGFVDRIRSMPIFDGALLVGHVLADLARNMASAIALIAFSYVIGFRPQATPIQWLYIFGIALLFTLAISWLSAIAGLLVKNIEAVQWISFVIVMPLTFASSAFVPTDTMPTWLRIFAQNQPFTKVIESMRAWFVGTPIGNSGWLAVIWCVAIIVVSMPIAIYLYKRKAN